ncbi:MAG: hypothetical protein MUP49_07510 [Dehalococcoidia bacterium]|nr:hypothetical protein [Dehalococcoidia bacterium]
MRLHVIYAVVALVIFVALVIAYYAIGASTALRWSWIFGWAASVIFSTVALYTGAVTAVRADADKRGAAIASATIGAIVLWALTGLLTWGIVYVGI